MKQFILQMSSLTHLDISNNLLSGHISEAISGLLSSRNIANLINIKTVAFENNMLIGEAPSEYGILRNIALITNLLYLFKAIWFLALVMTWNIYLKT